MEYNPRKVFLELFGEGDTPQERAAISHQTSSLLDLILDRTKKLQGELGSGDRAALDGYLDSVREIERRTQKASSKSLSGLKIPDAPVGELDKFPDQVKLMFDLLALAFQADLTRVATYIMVAEGTNRTYNHIGVPDSFHPVSHHANDIERLKKLVKIQTWHVEQFSEFVKKMAETPDGQGSLLDHSIFMYGSNMSNSDLHNNYPEPNIVIGGGAGKMKLLGQHLVLPERTPDSESPPDAVAEGGVATRSFRRQHRHDCGRVIVNRRELLKSAAAGALGLWAAPRMFAQTPAGNVRHLTDKVAVLDAGGANVVAFSGGEGLVLVDSGAPKISHRRL